MLHIIIVLIVIGFLMWLANTYIPMQDSIRKILNIAVVILVVLWLLSVFGIFSGVQDVPVRHVRPL